jgi:hypothetical protein
MRGLLVGVNAQRFGSFECGCFSRKCLDGTDYCLPAFVRSIKGGFPPAEDPNVGPTLPPFALHASLLIPCSPKRRGHPSSSNTRTSGLVKALVLLNESAGKGKLTEERGNATLHQQDLQTSGLDGVGRGSGARVAAVSSEVVGSLPVGPSVDAPLKCMSVHSYTLVGCALFPRIGSIPSELTT